MINKQNRGLYITAGVVVLLLIGLVVFLWSVGLFDFSGTDASSKIVGAVLALVGALVAAVLTFIGVILKQSYDQQAEQRLKLDSAVRMLQLFSTSSGSPTPDIQRDGALFALANLGQYELTLQIANELLNKKELSAGTASNLIEHAIIQGDMNVKGQAVMLLYLHPLEITTPNCLVNWVSGLPRYVREWAVYAMSQKIFAYPASEWNLKYLSTARGIVGPLCLAWESENVSRIKNDTGAILKIILSALPSVTTIFHTRKVIDTDKIRAEVANCVSSTTECDKLIERLNDWASLKDKQEPKKK